MLRDDRRQILAIAAKHRAANVAVFGSVARGDDTASSDIDLLVDLLPGASLIDEFRLENELRKFLPPTWTSSLELDSRHATSTFGMRPKHFERVDDIVESAESITRIIAMGRGGSCPMTSSVPRLNDSQKS